MKIAYIGLRGIPASYSGVEKAVEEIGSRLSEKHDITVYCMKRKYIDRPATYKGMKLEYIPSLPGKNVEMISYAFLSTLRACFSRADIIHFHAIGPSSFALLARLFLKKTISTNHGLDWKRAKWGKIAKLYLQFGEYVSAKFTHATISVSGYIKDYYKEKYGAQLYYIPNGKDNAQNVKVNLNALDRFKLHKGKYLLFVGRVTPEKGIQNLCQAFCKMSKSDLKLAIVGGSIDDYKNRLADEFKHNADIIFTNPIYDRNELAGLYTNANMFVLPSEIEGQSIVILEALSYGCRVLASDIPENKDLLKHFGNYFEVGNITNLQETLMVLSKSIDKPDPLEITAYLQLHNWDKIALDTETLYKKIIKKGN